MKSSLLESLSIIIHFKESDILQNESDLFIEFSEQYDGKLFAGFTDNIF
jgi:hypothetical protein